MDSQRPRYCTAYEASVRIGCALEEVHALFSRRGDYAVLEEKDCRYPYPTTRRMLVPATAVEEVAAQYEAAKAAFFAGASVPEPKQEAKP